MLDSNASVGVLGVGTMGLGIAQLAAQNGHNVVVYDNRFDKLQEVPSRLDKIFSKLVGKGRMSDEEKSKALSRVRTAVDSSDFSSCSLVIEAIVEKVGAKQEAFLNLEKSVPSGCILATNTSSLSIASVGSELHEPKRFLGIHFFNPAPVMPLVEIVPGLQTDWSVVRAVRERIESWGKVTVTCKDTPGFIVNRIARPFYGEALRMLEEGFADAPTIDWAMREVGGFRMGPFELMDFIGNDVNYQVSTSVFEAFYYDPRFRPSLLQRRMVEAKQLGRKTGKGFYDYSTGATHPEPVTDKALGQRIFFRILSMLINEAADAVFLGVASPEDIDTAMTKGVNYPKGLLAWADEVGIANVVKELEQLQDEYREDRYRVNPLLRRMNTQSQRFYS